MKKLLEKFKNAELKVNNAELVYEADYMNESLEQAFDAAYNEYHKAYMELSRKVEQLTGFSPIKSRELVSKKFDEIGKLFNCAC